ncbi:oligopeptidase A [Alteromonas sp. ASW11-130]|uniref:oligopeptidase A n=1 Tax=Alteromonas sp. ASW11-130 TaxID=3015775 RepID=UPI0022420EDD|nr:oligopeptidase A [Alteromonas sp. ASW11-130]MCW8091910.1 oligopeptidase A [Alteromonas sp. ASW11-130]
MTVSALEKVDGLPLFSQIKTQDIKPAIERAIAHCKEAIEEVVNSKDYSFKNVVTYIDEADDGLSKIWSPVSHMNSVLSSDDLRQAHDACLPLLSDYSTWVGQHEGLYKAYCALRDSEEYAKLDEQSQKHITNTIRDFTLSGVALPADKKTRFAEIQSRLSELASSFSNNVMDATMGWTKHVTDKDELKGLPDSALDAAAEAAKEKELEGWLFTLDIPSYLPVMLYADNQALREEMYVAYVTRASELGPNAGKWDNSSVIKETLQLRTELARLLGFDTFAERSLATKMASSTEQVLTFLHDLASRSLPQAKKELEEVKQFAKDEHGIESLNAWDIPYFSEKLKQQRYTISDEMLRPYFPEERVLGGLFEVVKRLYGITIKEQKGIDTWHKDVRYFTLTDEEDVHRGSFYLDLYARANKRGGAWMDECRVRRRKTDGELQQPVAFLTCNFNRPVGDKPALFTHDEVVTLFHEFGHGIHHMLTKMSVAGVSGINGVPWDAVELPSQFLENWCWEKEALSFISGHWQTHEPLPEDLLERMLAARDFQSAMLMVRQLEFSLFDFILHSEDGASVDVQKILDEVREEVAVNIPPEFNRFQHSFGHVFAGGYAAGYYSYKWAEVLSADAYSKFEEEGIFNRTTGRSFLHNILEMGGSREPMDLFVAFRGREPKVDALLRHNGIVSHA